MPLALSQRFTRDRGRSPGQAISPRPGRRQPQRSGCHRAVAARLREIGDADGAGFGLIISVTVFLFGSLVAPFQIGLLGLLALPLLFAMGNLCFAAMGVLLSSPAGPVPSNIMMLSSLVRFPLIFISGIFVPLSEMSGAFRGVTLMSPLTYLVDGLNHALGNEGVIPLALDMLVLLAFTVVFLLAANHILKRKALKGL